MPMCLWPIAALATANVMTTERGFDRPGADFMRKTPPMTGYAVHSAS